MKQSTETEPLAPNLLTCPLRDIMSWQAERFAWLGLLNGTEADQLLEILNQEAPLFDQLDDEITRNIGIIPAMIVPRFREPLTAQFARIRVDEHRGKSLIYDFDSAENLVGAITDFDLYLAIGWEDGRKYIAMRPSDAVKEILNSQQSPATAREGIIALALYPDTLKHHCFDTPGSITDDDEVPAFGLNDGVPTVLGRKSNDATPAWGVASCKRRQLITCN